MDRNEKIARLEKWLDEHHDELWVKPQSLDFDKTNRQHRIWDAVQHELQRQVDKKIIEELGLFDE